MDVKMLLRDINKNFVVEGRVTSVAFKPTKSHDLKLSTYDGHQISAQESYNHYTEMGLNSIGILVITCEECMDLNLPAVCDKHGFKEHVSIDFSNLTEKEIKTRASILREKAVSRDWFFKSPI